MDNGYDLEKKMMRMLSRYELADWLSIHPDTVTKFAKEGLIPFIRIGRQLRFDKEAVLEALTNDGNGARQPEPATSAARQEG